MRPRATAITFVLPKKSLEEFLVSLMGSFFFFFFGQGKKGMGERGERERERVGQKTIHLLSDNCVRTSLRYVLRMLFTLKT